ncbi:VOC family protein [Bacillus sp. SD088]|uniref:VOC family protein n=1 Tax=Bacillus sp. SD088 TaxID=2782012 RepID=UPI001A95F31F|nr:VOC family protein [Bacillus sp. SD088]MBO0993167.1 VOC family protein [Bacillus sp. SD088]
MMRNDDVNILHHVGLITKNMEETIERYERLGFTFTPLSMPKVIQKSGGDPEELGVGNRTAIFRNNYLEVLGVVNENIWNAVSKEQRGPFDIDEPLNRYEGLHVMHFGTDDLEAVRQRLVKQGTPCSDIRPFQRPVNTPEGTQMMKAKSLFFPEASNPEALIQIAQHLTPDLVLQPRYMQHTNGAQTVTEIIVCAPNPLHYADKYRMYTGCDYVQKGNLHIVELGFSTVIVVAPEHLGEVIPESTPPTLPYLAGFTVATSDLGMPRHVLTENQVSFQEHDDRLIVGSQDACGCAVLFETEDKKR